MSMRTFLKVYSPVPNSFIDDLFDMYDEETLQTDFVLDLGRVADWLESRKDSLLRTIYNSYTRGVDYTVTKPPKRKLHGGNNEDIVLITPDCFKRLCMRSRTKKAEDVRTYFIHLEALIMKYREQMMEGIRDEVQRLELRPNGRKKGAYKPLTGSAGYIYVLRASTRGRSPL